MKIVIDARLYGLENAGLGRYVINLVKELSKIDKENNYVIFLRKKYFNELELPDNWKKVLTDFRHYGFLEQALLPLYIYKEKPNIVHFPHFNVPLFYFGNYIVTIHDLLMHSFKGIEVTTRNRCFYLLKRFGYKIVFWAAVKLSKKILVPSNVVKKELIDYYKVHSNKVEVTHEGLDEEFIDSKLLDEELLNELNIKKPYLIYVGNAYPHKNLDKAIDAVKDFNNDEKKNLTFLIISSRNVFVQRLKEKVVKTNSSSFVKILGFITDNKLGIIYKNSLAFIYPSLSEGFGLQGLEAISSGTLVLASNIPVFKEIYDGHVLYFDPASVDSIKNSIKEAFNIDAEKRKQIIKEGKSFIKRYSWDKMARETLTEYENCTRL
ncbi:MAG TPA: glycosyltransferase family 1 protein [Patescibacteria group bacterium]|nr:glycosyltransferase family 1 protein [Patescibacteria group bacterium]